MLFDRFVVHTAWPVDARVRWSANSLVSLSFTPASYLHHMPGVSSQESPNYTIQRPTRPFGGQHPPLKLKIQGNFLTSLSSFPARQGKCVTRILPTISVAVMLWLGHPISQYSQGTIFHFPRTAFSPNFFAYHSLVADAVTARLNVTKMNAHKIVLLHTAPLGAAIITKER